MELIKVLFVSVTIICILFKVTDGTSPKHEI